MRGTLSEEENMKRLPVSLACCLAVLFGSTLVCEAGLRAPGKYSGVVIFDRWDGCTLYSGIYVMYVSEKANALHLNSRHPKAIM